MSFLKSLFSPKMQRATVIEHLIETLARRDEDHCNWVQPLSFEHVEAYMKDQRVRVLSVGQPFPDESVLYLVCMGPHSYEVRASRASGNRGVLFTSKFYRG